VYDAQDLTLAGTFSAAGLSTSNAALTLQNPITVATLSLLSGSVSGPGGITIAPGGTGSWLQTGFSATSGLTVSSGTNNGTTTLPAASLTWLLGDWASTGTLAIQPGAHLTIGSGGGGAATQSNGKIANSGVLRLTGGGLRVSGGSMTNSGQILLPSGSGLFNTSGTYSAVNNGIVVAGVVGGSAADIAELDGYAGAGVLRVLSGALTLRSVLGVSTQLAGGASVASGAILDLEAPNVTTAGPPGGAPMWLLPSGKALTGAGTLRLGQSNQSSEPVDVQITGTDALPQLTVGRLARAVTLDSALTLTGFSLSGQNPEFGLTWTTAVGGAGALTLIPGTHTLSGGSLANPVTVTSGTTLSWSDGQLIGPGVATINAGGTLAINASPYTTRLARTITNNGTITWDGVVREDPGAHLINNATATLSNNPQLLDTSGTIGLTNNGTLTAAVNPGSQAELDGYTGTGTVTITQGQLRLRPVAGVSTSLAGGASVASGAVLDLEPPNVVTPVPAAGAPMWLLPAGKTLSGAGGLLIGRDTSEQPVDVRISGTDSLPQLTVNGGAGTLTLDTAVSLGAFTLAGRDPGYGQLWVTTVGGPGLVTLTPGTHVVSAGLLAAPLTVTSGTTLTWSGGQMVGPGATTVNAGAILAIPGTASKRLARAVTNNGTLNWTGTINEDSGAHLVNNATITLTGSSTTGNPTLIDASGTIGFTNSGALTAAVGPAPGSGGGYPQAELDGYTGPGTLTITQGQLRLRPVAGSAASALPAGTVASGATLDLEPTSGSAATAGSFILPAGRTLTGAGTLVIGPNLPLILVGTDTINNLDNNGALDLGTTKVVIAGTYTQTSGASLMITYTAGPSPTNGSIATTGNTTLAGALRVSGTPPPTNTVLAVNNVTTGITPQATLSGTYSSTPGGYTATYDATSLTLTKN
jgi:fibronectin-binding autotransporter adhesin